MYLALVVFQCFAWGGMSSLAQCFETDQRSTTSANQAAAVLFTISRRVVTTTTKLQDEAQPNITPHITPLLWEHRLMSTSGTSCAAEELWHSLFPPVGIKLRILCYSLQRFWNVFWPYPSVFCKKRKIETVSQDLDNCYEWLSLHLGYQLLQFMFLKSY